MRGFRITMISVVLLVAVYGLGHTGVEAAGAGCGSAWGLVATPDGGPLGNGLYGLDAIAMDDVWAVGTYFTDRALSLIEHWDGSSWSVVDHPEKGDDSFLLGVDALSSDDVWAVGYYHDQVGQKTFAMHWDGSAWSVTRTVNVGLETAFTAVAAVGPDDVWAVGFGIPNGGGDTFTVAEHWDGAAWTVAPTPPIDGSTQLASVAMVAANDGWAVGTATTGVVSTTLVMHWESGAWNVVPSPNEAGVDNELHDVVALAGSQAWAVGSVSRSFSDSRPLVLRWDGSTWSRVVADRARTGFDSLVGRWPGSLWAVGGGFDWTTSIQRWNGAVWGSVRSPQPNRTTLHAAAAVDSDDVWAAGSRIDQDGVVHAVTEHHCPL